MLRTPLCDLLGIQHPVMQAAIRPATSPELVAAVSNAGGLGSLGAVFESAQSLERQVARVRDLADRPFAVNHVVPLLDEDAFALTLEAKPAVISFALGDPGDLVERAHAAGAKDIQQIHTVQQARHAGERGVDAIIAQGSEGEGRVHEVVPLGIKYPDRSRADSGRPIPAAYNGIRVTSSDSPGGAAVFQPAGRAEFVGRARELATLTACLQAARAGGGLAVLLAGEPGIGKTRTAEELAGIAASVGARVLWGRCYEGEGAPAFWPWVQVIRAYTRGVDAQTIRAHLGAGASTIAAIAPVVRERLPDLPPASVEDEHARFRLFEAVTAFLQTAAEDQPVVIVLDDLHWADTPSLLLLQFLGAELDASRVLVVGTYRDIEVTRHHPLTRTLAALTRQGAERVTLGGLNDRDVARYVELLTGRRLAPSLLARLQRETEGNPFFVAEVVRLIAAEGRLAADGAADLTIPDRVREVILERVDRLSVQSQRVLSIAAVLGRDFRVSTLSRVSELDGSDVLRVLEEAETARVIGAVANDLGRYRFAHALIRETLYEELTTAARIRLHRQAGEALEIEYAAGPEPHLAELAFHWVQAAATGDAEKAIHYATMAAERAMDLLAYEEAARHYEVALWALTLQPPPDGARRCDLLLALGEAHDRAGERQRAQETFRQAADVARAVGSVERLARSALGYGGPMVTTNVIDPNTVGLLEEARHALGEGDSALRARVLARLADELYFEHQWERSEALSREALAVAQRVGDLRTLAEILNSRRWVLWRPDNVEERLAIATDLLRLAEEVGDQELTLLGHNWRIADLIELGRMAEADAEIELQARLAEASRQPYYLWITLLRRAMQALLSGRFADAKGLIDEALALGKRVRPETATTYYIAQMFAWCGEQGWLQEVVSIFEDYAARSDGLSRFYRSALARIYCEQGREAEARGLFEELAADDFGSMERNYAWLGAMTNLAELCFAFTDGRRAAALYDLMRPYAGLNVVGGRSAVCFGSMHFYLGRLATTLNRWDCAADHFEQALAMHTRMGAWPWVARAQYAYTQMLWRRRRGGEQQMEELISQALASAREMGMPRLSEQVEALRQEIERARRRAAAPQPATFSDGLTAREVEVLRLLAAGRTTKEVADALSVSVSTVERHITNLYGKIGARGRADATAYALHHGIVDPDRT